MLDRSGPLVGWAKRETARCAIDNRAVMQTLVDTGGKTAAVDWLTRIPDYQRDIAASMGTRVHLIADQLAHGVEPTVSPDEFPYVDAYRDFVFRFRPTFLASEEMVCSLKYGYAGTLDAIARIGDETWLLDIKTGAGIYVEAGLQLAAYGSADFIGRPGSPTRFRIPRAARFGVIHLRPDVARLVEYGVDRDTFNAFLQGRGLYAWTKGQTKSVMGMAVTATESVEAA